MKKIIAVLALTAFTFTASAACGSCPGDHQEAAKPACAQCVDGKKCEKCAAKKCTKCTADKKCAKCETAAAKKAANKA